MFAQGFVDEQNQALITIELKQGPLDFIIDTAFFGSMIVGEEVFEKSAAEFDLGASWAVVASGRKERFASFVVQHEWMESIVLSQILIGPGRDCLIGTEFLKEHRLEINYRRQTVILD